VQGGECVLPFFEDEFGPIWITHYKSSKAHLPF
jgi:hypothetical protein